MVITGYPVWIATVIVPKTLDRTQLVRRASANRLDVSENNHWAAPLDDMARRVLSQDLATRLPEGMVIQPGEPLPSGRLRRIAVDLSTFESDLEGHVVLNAQWTLESGDNGSEGVLPTYKDPSSIRTRLQSATTSHKARLRNSSAVGSDGSFSAASFSQKGDARLYMAIPIMPSII
jgi:hypothetical protein